LWLQVLLAARRLGVAPMLEQEVRGGARKPILDWSLGQFRILPPKAYRWVPEMHEIGATLSAAGMAPTLFDGIAEVFELVARSPLGAQTVEGHRARALSAEDILRELAG